MDSFKRGFNFLKQSWQMALDDRDLIKPSIYALIAGFVVTLVGIIPMGITAMALGDTGFGQVILLVAGALLVFMHYSVGYIFSAMTVYLIYGYLAEGDGRLDLAWEIVRRDFLDILRLAVASTLVNLVKSAIRGKGRSIGRNFLSGLLNTIWTEATYLILPAMVIEDIGLKDGLRRASQILQDNLLLVGISTVGVRAVSGLIGFLLGATGIGLGFGVGLGLVSLSQGTDVGIFSGVGLGILVAGSFIIVAVVISSYTATAYHTCLYLWARDVEQGRQSGQDAWSVVAPAPLAASLK